MTGEHEVTKWRLQLDGSFGAWHTVYKFDEGVGVIVDFFVVLFERVLAIFSDWLSSDEHTLAVYGMMSFKRRCNFLKVEFRFPL